MGVARARLREILISYGGMICDLWGVVHNGREAFAGAVEILTRFREGGGIVLLVSNAPRPSERVAGQLDALSVPRAAWDAILTSGDLTRLALREGSFGKRLLHIGPPRDLPLMEGLPLKLESAEEAEEAEAVLCTGLLDDTRQTAEDYRPLLRKCRGRDLPMLCANPDRLVMRGDSLIPCAGAVAALYEEMGGRAFYYGKPHAAIYERALAFFAARGLSERARIVAVGDGIETDMPGAEAFGLDRIFITGGIAASHFGDAPTAEMVADFFRRENLTPPTVFMTHFEDAL